MSEDANKEIVLRWITARNTNDLDGALILWDENLRERVKAGFNGMTKSFPDIQIKHEYIFGEGNKVAVRWTMKGTQDGAYQNVPATKKQITFTGIDIYTVENGKILSVVRESDNLGLLKQLGVTMSWQGEVIT